LNIEAILLRKTTQETHYARLVIRDQHAGRAAEGVGGGSCRRDRHCFDDRSVHGTA
jgi:hypothetical protein